MGIGFLTGIASRLAAAFSLGSEEEGTFIAALLLGSYGSAYGIVVGGVAGSLIRTDVGEAVHDPRWRVRSDLRAGVALRSHCPSR